MAVSLDIIIVNWNSGSYLRGCLDSLRVAMQDGFELTRVVVVDNASADGSADSLAFPDLPLSIIRNSYNLGFARACNQAATGCNGDYLLFLNPDTVLFPNSLAGPVRFMQEPGNRMVGICGIQLVDEQGQVARTCSSFPTPTLLCARMLGIDKIFPRFVPPHFLSDRDHCSSRRVDQVMGAFMLVRRYLFDRLKGFDSRFFVYFEDLDLALRSQRLGYSSFYLADAQASHAGGKCSQSAQGAALSYCLRSRIQYSWKHFGVIGGITVLLGTICLEPLTRVITGICRGSLEELREIYEAYLRLWRQPSYLASERDHEVAHRASPRETS